MLSRWKNKLDPRAVAVRCDACSAAVHASPTERPDGNGAVVMELVCDSCGHVEPIQRLSRKALDLRDELARVRAAGDTAQVATLTAAFQREAKSLR